MQLESKDIYAAVASKKGLDPELVKSVGDMVFRELNDLQRNPPDLILRVRGLGRRFLRKTKLLEKIGKLELDRKDLAEGKRLRFGRTEQDVTLEEAIFFRLRERYNEFLKAWNIVRQRRRLYEDHQTSTESPSSQEPIREAGPDNQSEC